MSADPKAGERNTLRGMNPPEKAAPASGPVESPRLLTEEIDPSDWRDLTDEEIELVKQGKPLPPRTKPLAGLHQREEPVDPTPVELPRHATAYEAPHDAAALTDHKTLETKTIKVDAESEQRRAPTQRSLKRPPKREVVAMAPAPKSKRWVVIAVVALVLAAGVLLARRESPVAPTEPTAPVGRVDPVSTDIRPARVEATALPPSTVSSATSAPVAPNVKTARPAPSSPPSGGATTSKPRPPHPAVTKPGVPDEPVF